MTSGPASHLPHLTEVLRRHAKQADAQARFPVASLQALREAGMLGLLVPVEFGGAGGSLACFTETAAELAGACLSTAMIWAMHCQQVDAVVRHGTPALRQTLLPRVAAGKAYLASVTTERAKGGHLLSALAALRADGGSWLLERDAPTVTGGAVADGFLITMRRDENAGQSEVSLVFAHRDQVESVVTGEWDTLGMRATESVGLRLTGRIETEQIVGAAGGFREVAVDSLIPLAHLGWAACWLGGARGAMREIVHEIRQPGRTWNLDLRSDLVLERLARIRIDLEIVSAYLSRTTEEVEKARADGRSLDTPGTQIHLNVLKVAAAELTFRAADRMMQLAGLSRGYSRTSPLPVERVFRDLRSASLNYSDDRLLGAIGSLVAMDRSVLLA